MQRHVVCKMEELRPRAAWSVDAGGRSIAVACVEENTYRAVADTCPHEMASLAGGKVEKMWLSDGLGDYRASESEYVIVCPWHNFEFDLDTGLSPCAPGRLGVKVYRARLEHDEVVVYV